MSWYKRPKQAIFDWIVAFAVICGVAFLLVTSLLPHQAHADGVTVDYTMGVGKGIRRSIGADSQHVGLEFNSKWYVELMKIGARDDQVNRYSFGRNAYAGRHSWFVRPYLRVGAAYWEEETVLISDRLTFDLAVGMEFWGVARLTWQHNSTNGRSHKNSGIDSVVFSLKLRF